MQSPIQNCRPSSPDTPDTAQKKEKSHNGDAADAASEPYYGTVRRFEGEIMNEAPVKVWLESNEGMFLQLCLVLDSSASQKETIKIALFHGSTCSTSTKKDCVRIQVSSILLHPCIPARYKRNLLKEKFGKKIIYLRLVQNREFLDECFERLLRQAFCRGLLDKVPNPFYSTADGFTRFFADVMTTPELHIEFCRIVNIAKSFFICHDNSRKPTFEKLMQVIKPGEDRAATLERFRRFVQRAIFSVETARDKSIRDFFGLNNSNEPIEKTIDITRGRYAEEDCSVCCYYGQGKSGSDFTPHGFGTQIYDHGRVFDGKWEHGRRNGPGFIFHQSGNVSFGMFEDGCLKNGTILFPNGDVYKGDFNDVEPNNFVRMMLIGRGFVGKSAFIDALKSRVHKSGVISRDVRTIGSNLHSLQLHASDGRQIEVSAQDCAGQRVAYISHCVHLSNECLYVLVWSPFKENRGTNELASVEEVCAPLFEWFGILASHAPRSQIVLVGTHRDTPAGNEQPAWIPLLWRRKYDQMAQEVADCCKKEVERLNTLDILKINITLHECACVDSVSGTNICDLRVKLGTVVGDMAFVKQLVPKRYKTIRQSFSALSTSSSPVKSKAQAIEALRTKDAALAAMPEVKLWEGVLFWAGHGVVLERNGQLFHDMAQMLDLIRPLVHPSPTDLLHKDVDKLLKTPSDSDRDAVERLLFDLGSKSELSLDLLRHFTAWDCMDRDQHPGQLERPQREAILSFLQESSLLCPLPRHTSKFRVTMRLYSDASTISSAHITEVAQAPLTIAYLVPIQFTALVPKLMSELTFYQPSHAEVDVKECCGDGIKLTRRDSIMVLKVTGIAAARKHELLKSLPAVVDSTTFGCVLHVAGNDLGLMHIAAACIEKLVSPSLLQNMRECYYLNIDSCWIRFQTLSSVACSLSEKFPHMRRHVAIVHAEGDGCGEFVGRLQAHIEQLSFTSVGRSMCEAGSLDVIKDSIMPCGVIVICISPKFFLNKVCIQTLQWALEKKRQGRRHVAIVPVHPAVTKQRRQDVIKSNILFDGKDAWLLPPDVLQLLYDIGDFADQNPAFTLVCPWRSDDQGKLWKEVEESTSTRMLTSGENIPGHEGLVNRLVFDAADAFIKFVAAPPQDCKLDLPLPEDCLEPVRLSADYVPDGLLDSALYPDDDFADLTAQMQQFSAEIRQAAHVKLRVDVIAAASSPKGFPLVLPDDCRGQSRCQYQGETYFKKIIDLRDSTHKRIWQRCSKVLGKHNVPIHGICNHPGQSFILLKYFKPERRLDEVIKGRPISMDARVGILRMLALAVLSHQVAGWVHGQICLSRIYLDENNVPWLRFPGNQGVGMRFSSPECANGSDPTASSDVFSWAMVGWAVLMWKLPYDGEDEATVLAKLAASPTAWQSPQLSPNPYGLPDRISGWLDQCLCHNPQQRLGIAELADAMIEIDRTLQLALPLDLFPSGFFFSSISLFDAIRRALPSTPPCQIQEEIDSPNNSKCAAQVLSLPAAQDLMGQCQPPLTFDEAASIFVYTASFVYDSFNTAIRSLDDSQIRPWRDYAHILQIALNKLKTPPATHIFPGESVPEYLVVYRGLKHPLSEVSNEYTVGNTVYLHSVTSTTTDDQYTLRQFGRPDSAQPGAAGTYMKLYVKSAKCVEALSRHPHEQEHMISFNAKFRVEVAQSSFATKAAQGLITRPPNLNTSHYFNDIVVLRELD